MKATAQAPANIAFIKYWGKADETLRIPLNDSLSMNLSGAYTTTTVEFSRGYNNDSVELLGGMFSPSEKDRIIGSLNLIREKSGLDMPARVVTKNTFPKGAGAAASASGFAALTVAAFAAAGISASEKELTIFARLGSGSACRSIPDGFVIWEKGYSSDTSYARSLHPSEYWDIRDLLVIVDSGMKKISTTDGMKNVATSPKLTSRLSSIPGRMERLVCALGEKKFSEFGQVVEEDCLDMHAVMQTQVPPLLYWNDTTRILMDAVRLWRKEGVPVYFTIDAGPNVHVLCEGKHESLVMEKLRKLDGIESIIANRPSAGVKKISEHLF